MYDTHLPVSDTRAARWGHGHRVGGRTVRGNRFLVVVGRSSRCTPGNTRVLRFHPRAVNEVLLTFSSVPARNEQVGPERKLYEIRSARSTFTAVRSFISFEL